MPRINTYPDNVTIEDDDNLLTYDSGAAATKLTRFATVKAWLKDTLAGTSKQDVGSADQVLTVRGGSVVGRTDYDTLAQNTLETYAGSSLGGAEQTVKAALDSMAEDVEELKAKADASDISTGWSAIADAVSTGRPYAIGDTISEPWTDIVARRSYDNPWRVNHYEQLMTQGKTVNGVWLQCAYAHPFGVQFSHQRAFLACPEGLAAGTYHIALGATWGSKDAVKDSVWQFTLTEPVEAGGCLAGFYGMPDTAATTWKVYNYKANRTDILETVQVTAGSGGTDLGTMQLSARSGNVNSMQETAYGWNRWSTSAMRQYLNSDAGIGEWWAPQDQWDVAPEQLATKPGFLTGLPKGMVDALVPVKVSTFANTVQDGGVEDITYDKVTLISLQQMYVVPQIQGEGEAHDYWKQVNGTEQPFATGSSHIYPEIIHYAVENHASAQGARAFRSAYRGIAYHTWYVFASGSVYSYGTASPASRPVPLVFIGR